MPEGPQIQKMFSKIARRYDFVNHALSLGMDFYWWRRMAQKSGAAPQKLFLDVAAGTGDSSIALARLGAEVISTDFTHSMLRLSASKSYQKNLEDKIWGFADADAQRLPFRSSQFDGVTVCYGVRNIENRAQAFKEFLRVLKPQGQLTILEFSTPPNPVFRKLYDVYSFYVLPLIGSLVAQDRSAYDYLRKSIRAFPNQASLASELSLSGFKSIEWINLTGGIVAIHSGIKE